MSFLGAHARTFTRSSIASVIATGAEFALLPVLVHVVHLADWAAYGAVQFVGTLITFMLSRYWAFEAEDAKLHSQGFKYAVVFGGSFALNTALPSVGSYVLHREPVLAFGVSQVLVYLCWNYPMNKYWVFRK